VLRYGGSTTCVEVRLDDGSLVIIDAGSGIHALGRALLRDPALTEFHLLLTHAHWDHLTGFPFFAPAYFDRYRIHVRGGPEAQLSLLKYLEHQLEPPYFPVGFGALKARFDFISGADSMVKIGDATIVPIPLSHPNGGYGFAFHEPGKSFVFLTDNEPDFPHPGGLREEDYVEATRGVDLLIHDAQYNDDEYARSTRGWGHSTYSRAALIAAAAGVQRFVTFHHDPDHDDREIDRSVRHCRRLMRERRARVWCAGGAEGMVVRI